MADLELTFACGPYDRMEALRIGEVKPKGIKLNCISIQSPRTLFDRLLTDGDFDISEMGASTLLEQIDEGDDRFVGIPIYPSKVFRHGFIFINADRGISEPKDLAGKRIGAPMYIQTAAIWARAHLTHDYGVDLSGVKWVQGAVEKAGSHGLPGMPKLLKPVDIERAPPEKSLNDMLVDGEIDALLGSRAPDAVREGGPVRRLWPNYREVEREYFIRTGIHPIMHTVVIRREVYDKNPWIAESLYEAFDASKNWALQMMRFSGAQRLMLPWLFPDLDEIDELFGGDPWPSGIAANRVNMDTMSRYMVEQDILSRHIPIEEAFLPFGT